MANLLNRFQKTVSGSNKKIADYVSRIEAKGDFKRISDLEVILSSWSNILVTPKRSYQWDPDYGSDLYKMIFEPTDDNTVDKIVNETVNVLRAFDDRATITDVNVTFLRNLKGFSIAVDVEYEGERGALEVVIDENVYFKFFEVPEAS